VGRYEVTHDKTTWVIHAACAVDAVKGLRRELLESQKRDTEKKMVRFDTPIKVKFS